MYALYLQCSSIFAAPGRNTSEDAFLQNCSPKIGDDKNVTLDIVVL